MAFLEANSTRLMAGPVNVAVLRELRSEATTLATLGQALDRLERIADGEQTS